MFFDEQGPFAQTARDLIRSLRAAAIEHVFVGAVACKAHGGAPGQEKIDFCVREPDRERFRETFAGREFELLPGQSTRYCHPRTQVRIELLVSGQVAGDRLRQQEVRWPDPAEAEWIDGVPVAPLARLLELELASWRPEQWRAAAKLIAVRGLDLSFAERLHPVVRAAYAECRELTRGRTGV